MKKITLFILALFMVVNAGAQLRWGVKAGGNLSKYNTYKRTGYAIGDLNMKFGFNVGGVVEYSFGKVIAVQPELNFMMSGGKIEEKRRGDVNTDMSKSSVNISQLQLPVNLKAKIAIDSLKHVFVMAGPYVGMGLSAKQKYESAGRADVDLYSKKYYSRFDYGINTAVGIEVKKITLGVGYQFSFKDIDKRDESKAKLGTALLSVGYFF